MRKNIYESAVGKKIHFYRKKKVFSQQDAADSYGCSLRWWQEVERGRNLTLFVLFKVAEVLGVEAWLLLKI
jgi:transcriptional regulator with XRE-family HTH domain